MATSVNVMDTIPNNNNFDIGQNQSLKDVSQAYVGFAIKKTTSLINVFNHLSQKTSFCFDNFFVDD